MIISQADLLQEDVHIYLKSLLFTLKKEELIRYEELTLKLLISISHCYESPQRVIPTQKKNPHAEIPSFFGAEGCSRYKQVIKMLKQKAEKTKDTNQLIFLVKLTSACIQLLNSPKFQFFTANQRHVYVYLMQHLLKELLYELPLTLRDEFQVVFDLEKHSEIRRSPFFPKITSVLVEIGNYQIINEETQNKNFEFIAEYFTFFLKALVKGAITYPPNFDVLFEVCPKIILNVLKFLCKFHPSNFHQFSQRKK